MKALRYIIAPVCGLVLLMAGCNLNGGIDESDIYFPVQKEVYEEHFDAVLEGTLIFDGNCLRIRSTHFLISGESLVPLWPYGYSLCIEGKKIQILDNDGQVVARVGDAIKVGGGQCPNTESAESIIGESLPDDCEGPYWIVADVEVLD